jgi:hypothetical protein
MPIQIPNLDDRDFDQLLNETYGVIARYFPEYAEVGPSDPAVALNELFCFLIDMAGYQQNRITPAALNNFAALLGIKAVYGHPPEEALRQALTKISAVERAVTTVDIETIIIKASADKKICSAPVERVYISTAPGEPVKVFLYQEYKGLNKNSIPNLRRSDAGNLYIYLRERSPLGTRLFITHSPILSFDISAEIVKRRDITVSGDNLGKEAKSKLETFFSPLKGGDRGTGWEFGKSVSRGDIYALLEGISGVDYVRSLYVKESNEKYFGSTDTLTLEEGSLVKLNNTSILVR